MSAQHNIPKLKDPSLFKEAAYINGEWVKAKSGATFEVHGKRFANFKRRTLTMAQILRLESSSELAPT